MAFDKNWPRWIKASIAQHVEANKNNRFTFWEGQPRKTSERREWLECRLDGPFVRIIAKDYYYLEVELNILVTCQLGDDFYNIEKMVGDVAQLIFVDSIGVFKYGSGPDDNPAVQIGCLTLDTKDKNDGIDINHYGQIEPKVHLLQATVEGSYWINLP